MSVCWGDNDYSNRFHFSPVVHQSEERVDAHDVSSGTQSIVANTAHGLVWIGVFPWTALDSVSASAMDTLQRNLGDHSIKLQLLYPALVIRAKCVVLYMVWIPSRSRRTQWTTALLLFCGYELSGAMWIASFNCRRFSQETGPRIWVSNKERPQWRLDLRCSMSRS